MPQLLQPPRPLQRLQLQAVPCFWAGRCWLCRRCGAPQRPRHSYRLDGPAWRHGPGRMLPHHRAADQRDGHAGSADGRADRGLAQWRDGHGPWGMSWPAAWAWCSLAVWPTCTCVTAPKDARSSLQMRVIARAVAVLCAWIGRLLTRCSVTPEKLSASERPGPQTKPSNGQTSTQSPAATGPWSWPSTTSALASLMLRKIPAPCEPVSLTSHTPEAVRDTIAR